MLSILIAVLLFILVVGGGGYYGYRSWGLPGGFSLGSVLLVLFVLWLFYGRGGIG